MSIDLETDAGVVKFSIKSVVESGGVIDFDIVCVFFEKFSNCLPNAFFCRLYREDIKRLVGYFDDHRAEVVAGTVSESRVYMPLENDFQIRFMTGEAESLEDGYFSIGVMFNCGGRDEESSDVFFGFEAAVDFSAAIKFCVSLRRMVFS